MIFQFSPFGNKISKTAQNLNTRYIFIGIKTLELKIKIIFRFVVFPIIESLQLR